MTVAAQNRMVHTICTQCHTDQRRPGGVSFEHFDIATAADHADLAEKMVAKLRAGMMPPLTAPKRPDPATSHAFVVSLEAQLDRAAALHPDPGSRTFQRLNRAEYARAVHALLGLDVDVSAYLPDDTSSAGFDDVADVQTLSPTVMEAYLSAADHISRLAVGEPHASATSATYTVSEDESQMRHVDGTPFGTRGGIAFTHTFPADGDYVFKVNIHGTSTGELFGNTELYITHKDEPVVVCINGRPVARVMVNPYMDGGQNHGNGLRLDTPPIHITAGQQQVAVAFLSRFAGPVDDLTAPIEHTLADSRIGTGYGVTALPHLQDVTIAGPFDVTGVSDTPTRRLIFSCHPDAAGAQRACAAQIVRRLSTEAFRQPVTAAHLALLMKLYDRGAQDGGFEGGVQLALQGVLADPLFLFRFERVPATVRAGQIYRIDDLDLASRLSYFIWSAPPDAELVRLATAGRLHEPAVLDAQVRRMLRDPRSMALSTRFAAQWLRLQDVDGISPNSFLFPNWDRSLSDSFKQETELFFNSIVQGDRSVLDLLTADYTYVNQRLARFYRIPNVAGPEFRRVSLAGTHRRGILGEGSILLQTSVADRTDPVLRGKWVLEVLLGQPPPPPPPNVPPFDATNAVSDGKPLTVRQRMEEHRKSPFCASCHRMIDPIGLALEDFDATGAWRIGGKDSNGVEVDTSGTLYDGSKLDGLQGLVSALAKHQDTFVRVFTENLMTYALGRRVEYYDMPTVRAIVRSAGQHDDRFSSFVLGIVNSDAFRKSRAATLSADTGQSNRRGH
jgi:Protein of unknown function (DUF1592)/Protein of unknown function (DUF1588)/Protein of unknown function (DUF1585)/Protein of unknown function (DUF1587)/Protein of unknown function (DUF1595)